MDEKIKKTLDLLCADTIDVEEAADILDMSIEAVFELVDGYIYVPTSEEVIEACEIERETLGHIKIVALQNVENKARGKLTKPLSVSEPSYVELMTPLYDLLIPCYDVSDSKIYSPLGLKAHPVGEIVITPSRRERAQYEMPDSYYGHTVPKKHKHQCCAG
ncbi:hypothetical protein CW696_04995 [ANME-2 cluster archaeon]|nr:MAG: hypothetical protein CW696_04995 [ANME-2 cluster archaeon]